MNRPKGETESDRDMETSMLMLKSNALTTLIAFFFFQPQSNIILFGIMEIAGHGSRREPEPCKGTKRCGGETDSTDCN